MLGTGKSPSLFLKKTHTYYITIKQLLDKVESTMQIIGAFFRSIA